MLVSAKYQHQSTPVFLPGEFHGQRSGGLHTPHGVTKSQTCSWEMKEEVLYNQYSGHQRMKILSFMFFYTYSSVFTPHRDLEVLGGKA